MSSIIDQANAIRVLLDGKVDGAPAYIASDFINAYEILKNKPGTCKIAILFEDEKARSNFAGGNITGRVDRYFDVIISRGRGLEQTRSDNLTVGSGGGLPLFALAEQMRDILRVMSFNPYYEVPDYVGMSRWGKDMGINMDAFKVSIWVGTQLGLRTNIAEHAPVTT